MPPEKRLAYGILIQALHDARNGQRVDLAGLLPRAMLVEVPRAALVETLERAAAGRLRFFSLCHWYGKGMLCAPYPTPTGVPVSCENT